MPIFTCPHCQQSLSSQQDVSGMAFVCPACGQMSTGPGVPGITMTTAIAQAPIFTPPSVASPTVVSTTDNPVIGDTMAVDQAAADYPQYPQYQQSHTQYQTGQYPQYPQPQYQPQYQQPPYQQPQPQSPSLLRSSSGFSWRTALTVLTCVLLAAVLIKQFWPSSHDGGYVVPPAPDVKPSVKNVAEAIVSADTSAAYYLSRVFTRAAQLIEKDGKAPQPRLTKTEQVAEDFVASLGAFAVGGKFEGKFVGLPSYIADNFKQAGFPTTAGALTAEARASAVQTCTTMADAFLKVADQVK